MWRPLTGEPKEEEKRMKVLKILPFVSLSLRSVARSNHSRQGLVHRRRDSATTDLASPSVTTTTKLCHHYSLSDNNKMMMSI